MELVEGDILYILNLNVKPIFAMKSSLKVLTLFHKPSTKNSFFYFSDNTAYSSCDYKSDVFIHLNLTTGPLNSDNVCLQSYFSLLQTSGSF